MASYYDAVMDKVAQFGNNNEVAEIQRDLQRDLLRIMMKNEISDEDIREIKKSVRTAAKESQKGK